jgi:hypothetical protein
MTHKLIKTDNYLLVVDDSDMVGNGYRLDIERMSIGIIDDDYFYNTRKHIFKKVIAHLPINDSRILEGVDLLPPYSRHQEDGVDALGEYHWKMKYIMALDEFTKPYIIEDFKAGYNKAREKYKYTQEDIRKALLIKHDGLDADYVIEVISNKYLTEFKCEVEVKCTGNNDKGCFMHSPAINCGCVKPKTVTTAQGRQWVGKYK